MCLLLTILEFLKTNFLRPAPLAQQMADGEDQFAETEGIGGVNIALHDLVVHQAVGELKASRSTVLRIFIRGMKGLLGRGSKPPILQGPAPACRVL